MNQTSNLCPCQARRRPDPNAASRTGLALTVTRPYFQADQDDPVDRFIVEAAQHPVFELTPIGPDSPALCRQGLGPG